MDNRVRRRKTELVFCRLSKLLLFANRSPVQSGNMENEFLEGRKF